MALVDTDVIFPYNVVDMLKLRLPEIDDRVTVVARPIVITDQNLTASVVPTEWKPVNDSREMIGRNFCEPTFQLYNIDVQGIVTDMDPERGRRRHAQFASAIRALLYRDRVLQLALSELETTDAGGNKERFQDLIHLSQKLMGGETKTRGFVYLSTLTTQVKTQIVPNLTS